MFLQKFFLNLCFIGKITGIISRLDSMEKIVRQQLPTKKVLKKKNVMLIAQNEIC